MYEQVNHLENPLTPNQVLLLKKVISKFKSKVFNFSSSRRLLVNLNFNCRSGLGPTPAQEARNLRCCQKRAGLPHHGHQPAAQTPWPSPLPPRAVREIARPSGKLPGGSSSGKPQSKCWEFRV